MKVDVAVVGASPAGLRAAWAAASQGARVALLEARPAIGVPEPLAILAFDHRMVADARPSPAAVRLRVAGIRVRSPGGRSAFVDAPASVLDRTAFDTQLADEAVRCGASLSTGLGKVRWDPANRTLRAGNRTWEAAVVVFADGHASQVRDVVPTIRDPGRIVFGAAHRVAHALVPGRVNEVEMRVGPHAPGGRTQWNPLGTAWNHWALGARTPDEAVLVARACLRREAGADALDKAHLLGVGADAAYAIPGSLVADGVLACGGAAAQGGVEVGLHSGEMAGRHAAAAVLAGDTSAKRLAAYEREWKSTYMRGYRLLRRAADMVAVANAAELDALLAPWDGRRIPVRMVERLSAPLLRAAGVLPGLARAWRALPVAARLAVRSGTAQRHLAAWVPET